MGKIPQIATKEEFDNIIKDTKVLVIVDFFATWCGPCKVIAPVLEEWAEKYKDQVKFIKVDVDENEETAEACEVSAMPTFHFYKDGAKVDTAVGANKALIEQKMLQYMK